MSELVAVTRRLESPVDLLEVAGESGPLWSRGGAGLAGRGEALTIEVPRHDPGAASRAVQQVLDTIAVDDAVDRPGSGPVALGALPFDPRRTGTFVVPEVTVVRADDGACWITRVGTDGADPTVPTPEPHAPSAPTGYSVRAERDPDDWCDAVEDARRQLAGGRARKVVLARAVAVEADRPIPRGALLRRLRDVFPACILFGHGGFVGATPELLVARDGDRVLAHPMAGTAPRSNDPATDARLADELRASQKNQAEHRHTIDMIHDTLLPWCSYLDEDAEPQLVAVANVQHLATRLEGRLSSPPASVVELMVALHPTPAVCGSPRDEALAMIDELEQLDRGRYAGPVGWVDGRGNGSFAVGIRSAELDGARARVMAGVGVVADSDPRAELAETRAKLEAVLNALIRP